MLEIKLHYFKFYQKKEARLLASFKLTGNRQIYSLYHFFTIPRIKARLPLARSSEL